MWTFLSCSELLACVKCKERSEVELGEARGGDRGVDRVVRCRVEMGGECVRTGLEMKEVERKVTGSLRYMCINGSVQPRLDILLV
mmetsp:Transcript_34466/g.89276  ORF Transcript_34466/g.89276 Transcript_34466/m.89276 type:complete len:85 (+) Transcript_34466:750-1004(+)